MGLPAVHINLFDMVHCSQPIRAQGSMNVLLSGIPWSRMTDLNMPHLKPPGGMGGLPIPGLPSIPTIGNLLSMIGVPSEITDAVPMDTPAPTPQEDIDPANILCIMHQAPIAQGSMSVLVNGLGGGYISKKILECTEVVQGLSSVIVGG